MQQIVEMVEIKARADAINLSMAELARRARVSRSTPWRVLAKKTDTRRSTLSKLVRALNDAERACRAHLDTVAPPAPPLPEGRAA